MDWMSFLPSYLIEEISSNSDGSSQIPKALQQREIAKKDKRSFRYECLNIVGCIACLALI